MSEPQRSGLFSSIVMSHLVLALHGLVIFLFVLLVIFFRGVITYLPWIMAAGFLLLAVSGWLAWRQLQRNRHALRELVDSPLLRDRGVEIRLLGGMASLKLGAPQREQAGPAVIEARSEPPPLLVEDEEALRLRRLARLVKLKEQGALSDEEFELLRRQAVAEVVESRAGDESG